MLSFDRAAAVAALALLAACSPDNDGELPPGSKANITEIDTAALPPALLPVIEAAIPGMKIAETERKKRNGRVYFDIEGRRPDGSEVELDVLAEGETYRVVEIQRDIAWANAAPEALAAAKAAGLSFEPARVIESRQVGDGSIVYELFEPGKADEPVMEVRLKDGKAEALTQRSEH